MKGTVLGVDPGTKATGFGLVEAPGTLAAGSAQVTSMSAKLASATAMRRAASRADVSMLFITKNVQPRVMMPKMKSIRTITIIANSTAMAPSSDRIKDRRHIEPVSRNSLDEKPKRMFLKLPRVTTKIR